MFIAKITHCPFGEPFVCKENSTDVTELSSEGLTYLQFCSLIGQTILHFGYAEVKMRFVPPTKDINSNSKH